MPTSPKRSTTATLAKERTEKMKAAGFVTVEEAARLVTHPRSNIYHWMATGEVRREVWGAGRGSVFVSLADLMAKVPIAFKGKKTNVLVRVTGKAKVAPKKLRRKEATA